MIEKRAAQRHRVFKGGMITFDDSGVGCTVRNVSPGGAAVDLDDAVALPECFRLSIPRDNVTRDCRAVWRSERRIGLAFVHEGAEA